MWERFTVKKNWAKQLLEEATKEKQQDTTGSWQRESPYTEDLELLREVGDLKFDASLMRQAFTAGKLGDWAAFLENEKLSVWASVNVRECDSELEQEDENRKTFGAADPAEGSRQLEGREGSHCRTYALTANDSRLKTTSGRVSSGHGKKQCNWWCVACGNQYKWRNPDSIMVIQDGTNRREAKAFRAHAPPHGVCDNLDYEIKLLASQYQCDVSPVRVLVKGLQERSRLKMMEGLRKFIMMDNHEAIRTGDLENAQESYVPEAVVRDGADEVTLQREEEGMPRTFVNTTKVGDTGLGPPLVDEDWHATLSSHLPRRRRGKNGRLWTISAVDEMARQVEKLTTTEVVGNTSKNRSAVRQTLWEAHLKRPTAALEEPLRRMENGAAMAGRSEA